MIHAKATVLEVCHLDEERPPRQHDRVGGASHRRHLTWRAIVKLDVEEEEERWRAVKTSRGDSYRVDGPAAAAAPATVIGR